MALQTETFRSILSYLKGRLMLLFTTMPLDTVDTQRAMNLFAVSTVLRSTAPV